MAIVKKYQAEVVHIEEPVSQLFTVTFKPLGGRFRYAPGQFLHLTLETYDPSESWPESRCFSMQSAPHNENILITYAVKGAYTRRMAQELLPGRIVTLKLPYGELFTQYHLKENAVFIAGGTGITPYLSLFSDPSFADYKNAVLYAGFKDKSFNFYENDLFKAREINPSCRVVYYYENENGIINISEIHKINGNVKTYFISGPPAMIKIFKSYLAQNGVPQENIKTDDWE